MRSNSWARRPISSRLVQVQSGAEIRALAHRYRVARDPGERLEHDAVEHDEQSEQRRNGGAHQIDRRIGHRGASLGGDPARHFHPQREQGPAVDVGERAVDARDLIGLGRSLARGCRGSGNMDRAACACAPSARTCGASSSCPMITKPSGVPPPLPLSTGARGDHHDALVGAYQTARGFSAREIPPPGEIRGQRLARGEIDVEWFSADEILGARQHDIALEVDDHQRVDLQLLQRGRRDVRAHELRVRRLHVAVGVLPVAPVGRRQLRACRATDRAHTRSASSTPSHPRARARRNSASGSAAGCRHRCLSGPQTAARAAR